VDTYFKNNKKQYCWR